MRLELKATPEEVMRAVEALQALGQERHLPERAVFALSLALEESASNIVSYALRADPGRTFSVSFECAGGIATIELRDDGPAFDPTQAPAPEGPASDDRPPGGWGIQLVRRYMDEILYRRESGENVLRLTKRIPSRAIEQ